MTMGTAYTQHTLMMVNAF